MLKESKLKHQKGIVLSDAIVAVLIIMLFTGIITSLMVNIVLESTRIKMYSQHIDYITEIFEHVELLSYDEITQENLIDYVNNKDASVVSAGTTTDTVSNTNALYKIGIEIENYTSTDTSLPQLDIIKIITLNIETNINNKTYTTTMSTIKKATMDEVKTKLQI